MVEEQRVETTENVTVNKDLVGIPVMDSPSLSQQRRLGNVVCLPILHSIGTETLVPPR